MTLRELMLTSRYIAIGSFGFGTILFLAFILSHHEAVAVFGLFYIILAVAVNGYMLVWLLARRFFTAEAGEDIVPAVALILANIPVAFVYGKIVIHQIH